MWTVLHVQSMLSIRGTNFIAYWAYAERISSHAEHTRNRFHRMLSMRGNVLKSNISANSNTIWFRFLQEKYFKKFHACVPFMSLKKGVGSGSDSKRQCFRSVLIFSGSGSRGWGWRPIRVWIRIQSGSRALMTKNCKKNYSWKKN